MVVTQLVEHSLPIPEVGSSNPVIGIHLYWTFTVNCIEKTKIKKKRPGMAHFLNKLWVQTFKTIFHWFRRSNNYCSWAWKSLLGGNVSTIALLICGHKFDCPFFCWNGNPKLEQSCCTCVRALQLCSSQTIICPETFKLTVITFCFFKWANPGLFLFIFVFSTWNNSNINC